MSIGDRIRDLRWDLRLNQGELARRAGIAQNTLSQIELGKTTPSVPTLEKIARGLSMDLSDLLDEAPASGGKASAPQESGPKVVTGAVHEKVDARTFEILKWALTGVIDDLADGKIAREEAHASTARILEEIIA